MMPDIVNIKRRLQHKHKQQININPVVELVIIISNILILAGIIIYSTGEQPSAHAAWHLLK